MPRHPSRQVLSLVTGTAICVAAGIRWRWSPPEAVEHHASAVSNINDHLASLRRISGLSMSVTECPPPPGAAQSPTSARRALPRANGRCPTAPLVSPSCGGESLAVGRPRVSAGLPDNRKASASTNFRFHRRRQRVCRAALQPTDTATPLREPSRRVQARGRWPHLSRASALGLATTTNAPRAVGRKPLGAVQQPHAAAAERRPRAPRSEPPGTLRQCQRLKPSHSPEIGFV